ncbi:hypothetical protein HPULCUR_011462 [Helicostylum pulchrum]|uniref:Xylanolytic transcriptional activator regulatory domain-containing protein n=1 Tax=Helicostylum pulchrum TaxID=562976 RepID=A0ABP9YG50_9FUNG
MSDPARWQINQYAPPSLTPLFDPAQPQQQPQQQQSQQLRPLQPSPFRGYSTYTKPNIQLPEPDKADNRRTRISRACAKKRGPPKGYIEVLENRLKRMERILGNLADTDEEEIKDELSSSMTQTIKDVPNTTPTEITGVMAENKNKTPTELPLTPTLPPTLPPPPLPISTMRTRYIGDMSPLPFLAQKINFEDARIASKIGVKIKRFGQSLVLYEKDETKDGKNSNIALLEELNIIKPGETIKGVNDWIYKVSGVDKVTSDGLLKIYFAYIHSGLPVVNKQLFLKQYRGETGEYPSAPLLNAIYGAAVRYMETCDMNGDKISLDIEMQEGWSERLFENLITFVKGKYSPCISTVQALVIGQNHRASLDEKMASGWLLNSAAIRMAQDLGLHRSSECWDIPDSEKETRKRVWWSVYIMDKWSAASTGRPQTIFDEDCDESYPNESADWDEVMDINHDNGYPSLDKSVAQKAKNENIPIYQPFVQLVKLSEILGRILQGLYTPLAKKHSEKHGSDAIVTYLDNALSEWRAALPPALQISSINVKRLDSHGKTPLLSMSGLMYLSYCTLLILLHRPFIEKDGGQKTRSSQSSLSICTSAATRCVDIAEKMHYRDFLLVSWNFAIYPVFTAALIHIYNAANPDSIVSDVAKSNLIKAAGVIKRLSKLSSGAGRLYVVLRQLMKLRKIDIDSCELSDTDVAPKKRARTTNWDTTTKKPRPISTKGKQRSTEGNTTTKVSDVGRGASMEKTYINRSSSAELISPSANVLSDSEVCSTHSTPSSMSNGDWINGLYSQLQSEMSNTCQQPQQHILQQQPQQQHQHQQIHRQQHHQQQQQQQQQHQREHSQHSLEADPYSLRQFGLNMDSTYTIPPTPSTMPYQPNNNMSDMSNNNISSVMLPTNPADSFLFGLSDLTFSSPYNNTVPVIPNYDTTVQQQQQQQQQQPNYLQDQAMIDQTVFRNRPDNPFWSVPSSIELDDWTAYLLPQQPPPPPTTTNLQNSQQRGWNSSGWV